ncbi:protein kinase a catalytic subunit, putative [Ichthyophthirius multifiliis]|uniref:Protein kinase a catalytic subunit, putative n=1 Tax=Ichthyophthirius multifiliis TaxID=5932 RepID=G0QU88_ICHMU|nr:protein kinase a catalytic subunit, putative [Ichthyophthirius multifiliis]EGR31225.1 protein kinase a catalytic subunit, putative [Ichthyophthirius multifiliis]|eukprot:XP_004034711.1 protein kinase a catalytic subunit, putative [Ichthyophthirius multifiliis]
MKTLKKADIINRNQIEQALTEKKILQLSDHPFVVKLKFAFQNTYNIYFIMEYMPGGELFHHIKTRKRFSEKTVQYYSSQVILALEYLHETLNIVYRDLKPENILMDSQGNIKLSDFGLAKSCAQSTYSFCGTPEYISPEIIKQQGHGKPVDFWTLGCFIYEMIDGRPPFQNTSRQGLYQDILENNIIYPKHFTETAKDLLTNLLVTDPNQRLTIKEIKKHQFYSLINWDYMMQKRYDAPIKPVLKDFGDTGYFEEASNKIQETPQNVKITQNDAFDGFTYRGVEITQVIKEEEEEDGKK